MYKTELAHRGKSWVCVLVGIIIFLTSLIVLPKSVEAELAVVTSEPTIFVPNGEAAELLIDGNDSVYWLHIVGGDVYFRRYNSSHMPEITGKPIYLNGTNENVDAVWDDFGYIHFTWATNHFGAQSVMYAKIDTNGDFVVTPIKLSGNNTARDFSSAIAVNSLGQAFVAWDYWWNPGNATAEDVLYAMIDSDGTILFTQQYVAPMGWDTDFFGKKDIVVDRADNLHIIFDRVDPPLDIDIYYKKYASDGITVLVSEKEIFPESYHSWSSAMEAVLDSQDRINIGYSYGLGSNAEVFYVRIDLQGNVDVPPFQISTTDTFHSMQAYLALDDYDNSHVFWRDGKDGNYEIYYAAFDQHGLLVRGPRRMTNSIVDEISYFMGAVFDSNNMCIWSFYNSTGTYVVYPAVPETTIVPGVPNYGISPTFVTSATSFTFSVQDNNGEGITGTYYRVDALDWVNYTLFGPFSVSDEGSHSIFYNSTDNLGISEPTKVFDIVVDDTPPTTSMKLIGTNFSLVSDTWVKSTTSIELTAIDGGIIPVGVSNTMYRIWNGGSWTLWDNYSIPFTLGPADGISHVEVYSWDFLGNVESTRNVTYIVDNTPPTTQLHVDEPNYTSVDTWVSSSTSLMLTATDGGPVPVGMDETYYRIWAGSWTSWRSYSGFFNLGIEGRNYVEYYASDLLDNMEAVSNETFIVDNTPPTTQMSIGVPNYTANNTWVTSSTSVTLTAADGGAIPVGVNRTYYRTWAGNWTSWQEYTASFSLDTEGLNLVEFYSVDLLGEEEIAQVEPLIVDDTPPTTTLAIGYPRYRVNPSDWWNITSSTPLVLSAHDGGPIPVGISAMECRVLPSLIWVDCSSPFNLSGYGEGPQIIEYRSTDLLGNPEGGNSFDLIVDDSPPYSALNLGLPQYVSTDVWVTSETEFDIISPDNGTPPVGTNRSMYRVWNRNSWSSWISYSSPFLLGNSEGYSYVEYYAIDFVSNAESIVNETFIVDNTPPTTQMNIDGINYTAVNTFVRSTTSLYLTANDGGDIPVGVDRAYYRIWAGSWGPWQEYTVPFSLDTEGLNLVEFYSVDLLANDEAVQNITYIVDNTPPTTQLHVGEPNYTSVDTWVSSSTSLMLTASDGGPVPVGMNETYYRIWAGSWGPWRSYSGFFNLDVEGRNYVEYYASDLLDNMEAVSNETFIVDNTPPTTQMNIDGINYTAVNTFVRSTTSLYLTANDGGDIPVGVDRAYYRIWAGSWGPWQVYSAPLNLDTEGLNYLEYYANDALANLEAMQNVTLVVDNTPPTSSVEIVGPRYRENPGDYWNVTSSTLFLLNSTDGGPVPCGIESSELYVDDIYVGSTTELTLQGYDDGIHKIDFRAVDNLVNEEDRLQEHNTIYVNLDNTPPTTAIQPMTNITLHEVFALQADDGSGSGVQEILYSVDGGDWQTYAGEFSIDEYGYHTIAYRSVDNLGNTEQPKQLTFEMAEPEGAEENSKPLFALIFTIVLLFCGLIVSKRRPIEFKTGRSFLKTFLLLSLPFVLAEAITGIISLATGLLAIPPVLGVGMFVDLAILLAGLIVLAVIGRVKEARTDVAEEEPQLEGS